MPKQIKQNWISKIKKIAILRDEEAPLERTEDDEFTEDEQAYIDNMSDEEKGEFEVLSNNMEKFTYLGTKIKVEPKPGVAAEHQDDLVDLTTELLEEYNALESDDEKEAFLTEHKAKKPEKKVADSDAEKPYISFASKEDYTKDLKEKTSKLQKNNSDLKKDIKAKDIEISKLKEKVGALSANRIHTVTGKDKKPKIIKANGVPL